ncbi:MAG: PilZ domain-containing protein [Candidatus Omnitrophica bacterium]|nr:PilZ domain-containing protein [Candidatus Omnitrophota bacterium]
MAKEVRERRKYPRASLKYKINIICEGTVVSGRPKDYIFHAYTENLSEGGIRVILEKELSKASIVRLELFITSKKTAPIVSDGLVIWTKKVNPDGTKPDLFNTGIQFIGLGEIEQKIIRGVVQHCLQQE